MTMGALFFTLIMGGQEAIKGFTRHHAVIIECQLALLPSRRHYVAS